MKKLASIFLIAILFFNLYGYRIVTSILSKDADRQLELKLDSHDYDEAQLIELKIPLHIPYQNDQPEFERHYGEIEIDGKFYTYVKRKVENGVLILKCIANNSKEQIREAGNDYFKTTNGLDQSNKKQDNGNFAKNFWGEYDGFENDYTPAVHPGLTKTNYPGNATCLYSICLAAPAQPPEMYFHS